MTYNLWETFEAIISLRYRREIFVVTFFDYYNSWFPFKFVKRSWRYLVSAQSWWMYVFATRTTLVCPCVGVHRKASLINSSLLLKQYPEYLSRLSWMVSEMGAKRPFYWVFVGCCLCKTAFLFSFHSAFFFKRFVRDQLVQL